jgi:hypothetical protein
LEKAILGFSAVNEVEGTKEEAHARKEGKAVRQREKEVAAH